MGTYCGIGYVSDADHLPADNLQPLGQFGKPDWTSPDFLPGAIDPCYRVGLLVRRGSTVYGTCIRVAPEWILTAHHVVHCVTYAADFKVQCLGWEGSRHFEYSLDPIRGFFCSDDGLQGTRGDTFDLDYAFVRLNGPFPSDDRSLTRPLAISIDAPAIGTPAFIPQFECSVGAVNEPAPGVCSQVPAQTEYTPVICEALRIDRGPSKVGHPHAGAFTLCDDADFPYVYHQAWTEGGVSGAPIFNEKWQLVGVHTHGRTGRANKFQCAEWCTPISYCNNRGTRIGCIVRDAARRGFDFSDIPLLKAIAEKL